MNFNSTIGTLSYGTVSGLTFDPTTGLFSNSSAQSLALSIQTGVSMLQLPGYPSYGGNFLPYLFTSPSPISSIPTTTPITGPNVQIYEFIPAYNFGGNVSAFDTATIAVLRPNYLLGMSLAQYNIVGATATSTIAYVYKSTIQFNTNGGDSLSNICGYATYMTVTN